MFQKIRTVIETIIFLLRKGVPRNILYCNGGLGDDLLLTYILLCYYHTNKRKVNIFSAREVLFNNHPAVDKVLEIKDFGKWSLFLAHINKLLKSDFKIIHVHYQHQPVGLYPYKNRHLHMADFMLQKINISQRPPGIDFKPFIYSTNSSLEPEIPKEYILIHSSSMSAPFAALVKEWNMERNMFEEFAIHFGETINQKHFPLVQIGSEKDPVLSHCIDLRGKTNISQLISIISKAKLFIGLEGGIMHIARAFDVPQIVIYGGRTMPSETGYYRSNIINLYSDVVCSPCWNTNECGFDHKCMKEISPENVFNAIGTLINK